MRQFNLIDRVICELDTAVRTICVPEKRTHDRPYPGNGIEKTVLNKHEKKQIAGLMRVNHSGEVCAQALYQGQAMTAQLHHVRAQMTHAAAEEIDHLAWCEQRLQELDSHPSYLNFGWYIGSWFIGALAGLAGDQWSLGFVAETERQVSDHLDSHLSQLPKKDQVTQTILTKMRQDEMQHAHTAIAAGAADLPLMIKQLMRLVSKLMTHTSYHI